MGFLGAYRYYTGLAYVKDRFRARRAGLSTKNEALEVDEADSVPRAHDFPLHSQNSTDES